MQSCCAVNRAKTYDFWSVEIVCLCQAICNNRSAYAVGARTCPSQVYVPGLDGTYRTRSLNSAITNMLAMHSPGKSSAPRPHPIGSGLPIRTGRQRNVLWCTNGRR